MKTRQLFLTVFPGIFLFTSVLSGQILPERQWPGYRGYMASGVLDNANLPETFDFDKMENVRWKIKIPGMGISSPAIWGNKLFITTAVSEADKAGFKPGLYGDVAPVKDSSVHEWKVYCIDKNSGKIIWERTPVTGSTKSKAASKINSCQYNCCHRWTTCCCIFRIRRPLLL